MVLPVLRKVALLVKVEAPASLRPPGQQDQSINSSAYISSHHP